MNNVNKILTFFAFTALCIPSFANEGRVQSTVVEFEKGKTSLNSEQKNQLRAMLVNAKVMDKEIDVEIAAWADEPFPGEKKSLSQEQQEIAEARLESIRDYIAETKVNIDDIDTYNMAERPNWWSRTFNTDSNQFKSMFSGKNPNQSLVKKQYATFAKEGAPSRTVVVATLDD